MLSKMRAGAGFARVTCRSYAAKAWVGEKFKSAEELGEYLSKETWSVDDYLSDSQNAALERPSENTVRKLLKLSGLSLEGNDIERIQHRLGKQLSFIDKLHRIPLEKEASMDESKARLMPREVAPLNYEDLLDKIATQTANPELGEVEGGWDSTGLAKMKQNRCFVLREGLMHNRN
ncbi:hypothetical protein HG536_0C02530 [Torulaspora globosa]|uniref:Glutamyl-tRNA(Gln) amidotransferase subunit F, mitochondrial n=1 Tax=Torulaspora globosa TaxID=48254 RepID=A0A7G3ZEZ8_9SACH|nr:uncharacterized protein HG536_0C02530 [Torulaspora globosa]QLL32084.1 hypothetical protein HG536_0C02530 [Torulaspora globosa]